MRTLSHFRVLRPLPASSHISLFWGGKEWGDGRGLYKARWGGVGDGFLSLVSSVHSFGIHGDSISKVVFGWLATEAVEGMSSYPSPSTFRCDFSVPLLGYSWEHRSDVLGPGSLGR